MSELVTPNNQRTIKGNPARLQKVALLGSACQIDCVLAYLIDCRQPNFGISGVGVLLASKFTDLVRSFLDRS